MLHTLVSGMSCDDLICLRVRDEGPSAEGTVNVAEVVVEVDSVAEVAFLACAFNACNRAISAGGGFTAALMWDLIVILGMGPNVVTDEEVDVAV